MKPPVSAAREIPGTASLANGSTGSPPVPARTPSELHESLEDVRRRPAMRFDEALLALGLVAPEHLAEAREEKDHNPAELLGSILRRLSSADDESIHAGLAFQLGVPAVDLRHWPADTAVFDLLPAASARRYRAIPIHLEGNVLYVAVSDVLDPERLSTMRLATPLTIETVYAPEADIQWMLDKHYLPDVTSPVSDADLERDTFQYSPVRHAAPLDQLAPNDNVIVRLADQIIAEACRERASDIHIEPLPERGKTQIRVRIDGEMFMRRSIPAAYRDALVSRIKVMANLNVAEHRIPQDGKILFRKPGAAPVELRVAVLPTAGGVEDVVLRILDASKALPVTSLGLNEPDHRRLLDLIAKPYGILLVCGPTGSGKTTTLHALLRHLNDGTRKIWTVEDPVEITQPGLRQVEVNARAGLSFPTALRAFLRADPDVIMVGEIRDSETAKTALNASLTGHLVLSTLHTNTAPESVVRLLEMGMNPFNFADALLGVLAQRLVPCLCKFCREPSVAPEATLLALVREYGARSSGEDGAALLDGWRRDYGTNGEVTLFRAKGCPECNGTGYKGRIGLFELMPASPEIKRLVIGGALADDLFTLAVRQGMATLKQDGIQKILSGATELSQVLAVSER